MDKTELEAMYIERKMTIPAIAKHFGVSHPAIRYWFKKFGIQSRSFSEAQRLSKGTDGLDDETLRSLYESGMKQSEIGELYGITQSAIRFRMMKAGIKTRSKAHHGKTNGMYGRKHTPEAIAKMRAANERQFSTEAARELQALRTTKQIAEGRTGKAYNKLEDKVADLLCTNGMIFVQQYRLGRYVYDFYIPAENLIIEAHGTFWHADPRVYDHSKLTPVQIRNTRNDVKKAQYALDHGYKLRVVWEMDV